MEVQSECLEPPPPPPPVAPCDPQPPGKINKAAFKLFGKRRSGSGMAGFFSFRNKGANGNGNAENGNSVNGNSAGAANELIRSKTHDGLTSLDSERQKGEESGVLEVGQVRSLSKSLSFFSLLRRGSMRANDTSGLGRRGRGLKGFFSSMRWRRKERATEGEVKVIEGREAREVKVIPTEELKDVALALKPQLCQPQEDNGGLEAEPITGPAEGYPTKIATTTLTHSTDPSTNLSETLYTPSPSPLRGAKHPKPNASVPSSTPPLDQGGDPPSEPSADRLCSLLFSDVTSLKSFDSLTGCGDIIADAEEEGPGTGGGGDGGVGSATSSSSSSGGGGVRGRQGGVVVRTSPSRSSVPTHVPPSSTAQTPTSAPAPLPARARLMTSHPAPTQQPSGSGVVAYMGGGEEMASPDGVDDADMQGLWHMLPSGGENSPALPRPCPHPSHPASVRGTERRPPQVKSLGLSKIPVVGGGGGGRGSKPPAHGACQTSSPNETETKEEIPPQQDVPALRDEGYWDTPSATPTATPDDGFLRNKRIGLMTDSCSGDPLYDLYNEDLDKSDEEEEEEEEEDLTSTPSASAGDYKLSPPSQCTPLSSSSSSSFRSMKGSTSLPRESKIPLSVRQTTPPHSVSQSALSSALMASPPSDKPPEAPRTARTRIPVSKVPVRRPGNKPGKDTRGPASRK